jgi:hypothetical protein
MAKKMSEKGLRAVSAFERKYNSELEQDESPMGDGNRVQDHEGEDNPAGGPYKNTYGKQFYKDASSKAPEYKDPASPRAKEAVKVFRRAYRRGDD